MSGLVKEKYDFELLQQMLLDFGSLVKYYQVQGLRFVGAVYSVLSPWEAISAN